MNARFCLGAACYLSLAMITSLPAGEAETPQWLSNPDHTIDVMDVNAKRVTITSQKMRETVEQWGYFFVPRPKDNRRADLIMEPLKGDRVAHVEDVEGDMVMIQLSEFGDFAKANEYEIGAPKLQPDKDAEKTTAQEQFAQDRVFRFKDVNGRDTHVQMKEMCENLNLTGCDIVYPVLSGRGYMETPEDSTLPSIEPPRHVHQVWMDAVFKFRDVVTGEVVEIDGQEFRRGLWRKGALFAQVYPFGLFSPKKMIPAPQWSQEEFTPDPGAGWRTPAPPFQNFSRLPETVSAPAIPKPQNETEETKPQQKPGHANVESVLPPRSVKPAGTNVQSGSNPFGDPMRINPMFAPPAAKLRLLRVRVALFEVEPTAPAPKSVLMSADEMLEMLEDKKQYELIDSFDLTTVTGHETKVQQGRRQPVVTGSQMIPQRGPDGRATAMQRNQYNLQNVGTMLTVSPEMLGNRASLKLAFERSDVADPKEDKAEDDANDSPPSITTLIINTQLLLEDGQATILSIRNSLGVRHALVIAVEMLDSGEEGEEGGQQRGGGGGGFF
ncbi:hypothetical protein [Blastopirellula marina]|nr:hypothetical protein [Blastopirellula marina]